jgi:hypothetical protein
LEYGWTLTAPYPTSMQVAALRDTLGRLQAVYSRLHAAADLIGSWDDADLYRISQKSRTGDIEQTPAVITDLPRRAVKRRSASDHLRLPGARAWLEIRGS